MAPTAPASDAAAPVTAADAAIAPASELAAEHAAAVKAEDAVMEYVKADAGANGTAGQDMAAALWSEAAAAGADKAKCNGQAQVQSQRALVAGFTIHQGTVHLQLAS